ncbi:MAG: GHKL domain-containing protein [Puniceicoccales bacterium]|jgi:signal transduction histidine kinase|nr:GHKL domain-containing protein [Puniceicoccales bacterium]
MPLPRKRQAPLDRILGRMDDLDHTNLAILAQRLARERNLLETVFNTIHEGVIVIDPTGTIEYSNRAANRLVGIQESDTGKIIFWKLVPGLARSFGLTPDGTGTRTENTVTPVAAREFEITYPEPRHVRLHLIRLDDFSGTAAIDPARFLVILRDITAEKISTENIIEHERENSIFTLAAGVAHEIGNPLNSMNIHLQLILRNIEKLPPSPERNRISESAHVCAAEIDRLDSIIQHFLNAIRPSPPDLHDTHLINVIAEVLAILKAQCEDLGIHITLITNPNLPVISGDKNQLKQLFFNLLKNAMESMDSGGKIDITAEADDEFVCIRVSDTGKGIERDTLTRMFDPFFTTKKGGHGLGMMVVARILRAHGGDLDVESTPGHGTTITTRFPQKHRRVRLLPAAE